MNENVENQKMENSNNKMQPFTPEAHSASGLSSLMELSNASQIITGSGRVALDLVVIIDTSASMSDESVDLSLQIDEAIEKASKNCPSQLRATFLGIQGVWENTKFDQSASDYLIAHGASEQDLQARKPFKEPDRKDHMANKEDLCRAVIDVSKYFDWRDNACRAIFILGDEGMEGGGGVLTGAAVAKNDEAITAARNANVKVYTYQGTPNDDLSNLDRFPTIADRDRVTKEYVRLAKKTGGRSYIYTTGIANFSLVLQEILCDSLIPPIRPDTDKSSCSNVCDQLAMIISTVNVLAEITNKAIDSCCRDEFERGKGHYADCNCPK